MSRGGLALASSSRAAAALTDRDRAPGSHNTHRPPLETGRMSLRAAHHDWSVGSVSPTLATKTETTGVDNLIRFNRKPLSRIKPAVIGARAPQRHWLRTAASVLFKVCVFDALSISVNSLDQPKVRDWPRPVKQAHRKPRRRSFDETQRNRMVADR